MCYIEEAENNTIYVPYEHETESMSVTALEQKIIEEQKRRTLSCHGDSKARRLATGTAACWTVLLRLKRSQMHTGSGCMPMGKPNQSALRTCLRNNTHYCFRYATVMRVARPTSIASPVTLMEPLSASSLATE